MVSGLVQGVQLPPSMRHSKVEPPSEELKAKVGVVFPDGLEGLESMVVLGGVRSTVQVWLAGVASVLPAASVARTSKVWLPAVSAGEIVSRAGAGGPAAAVDAAFEARAALGRAEGEARGGVVGRVGRVGVDGRVRRGQVDRPGVAGGCGVGVAGCVGCAHLEGVAARGQCR